MSEDVNGPMNLRAQGGKSPASSWPVCLSLANLLTLLAILITGAAFSLKGEGAMAGILFVIVAAGLEVVAIILLLAALLRGERPWWAYHIAILPVPAAILVAAKEHPEGASLPLTLLCAGVVLIIVSYWGKTLLRFSRRTGAEEIAPTTAAMPAEAEENTPAAPPAQPRGPALRALTVTAVGICALLVAQQVTRHFNRRTVPQTRGEQRLQGPGQEQEQPRYDPDAQPRPKPAPAATTLVKDGLRIAGLTGWWKFDGDYKDSSGNGNDAVTDGGYISAESVLGLDGKHGTVRLENVRTGGEGKSFSYYFRLQPEPLPKTPGRPVERPVFRETLFSSYKMGVSLNAGRKYFTCGYYDGESWNEVNADYPQDGRWYSVACTYDAGSNEHKIYLDGALAGKEVTKIDPSQLESTSLGRWSGADSWPDEYPPLKGLIDEAMIFNRALTAAEVKGLHAAAR